MTDRACVLQLAHAQFASAQNTFRHPDRGSIQDGATTQRTGKDSVPPGQTGAASSALFLPAVWARRRDSPLPCLVAAT